MPSFTTAAFALATLASLSHAFESISIARTVTAGSSTDVSLTNDIGSKNSFDSQFQGALIMLATTPPGWGTGPVCTLANLTDISKTSVSVTIPADVGPSGSKYYQISTMEYNNDPNSDTGDSGFDYSSFFTLNGASGNWSQWELDGHSLGDQSVPCTSMSCMRKCTTDNYQSGDESEATVDKVYNCFAKCPGYPQDQEEDANGGAAGSAAGGDSASSTVNNSSRASASGSATSTASGAAKTTMSTAASASATQSGSAAAKSGAASTGASGSATHSGTSSAAVATATTNAAASYGSSLKVAAGVAALAALAL